MTQLILQYLLLKTLKKPFRFKTVLFDCTCRVLRKSFIDRSRDCLTWLLHIHVHVGEFNIITTNLTKRIGAFNKEYIKINITLSIQTDVFCIPFHIPILLETSATFVILANGVGIKSRFQFVK